MSDIKDNLEKMENLVENELKEVRTQLKEVVKGSARWEELDTKHEKILSELDSFQEKMDSFQTAINRVSAGETKDDTTSPEVLEHKEAFDHYLRTAQEGDLRSLEAKTLSVGSDPDGGYVAPTEMSNKVISIIYETSPMRQAATVLPISRKDVEFLIDKEEAGAVWEEEEGYVGSDTTTPKFGKLKLVPYKMSSEPAITVEMIADAEIDIEGWLASKVGQKQGRTENAAFVNGDGNGKPRGFTTYTAGTSWEQIQQVETAASSVFDEIDLISLMDSIKGEYLPQSSFSMSRRSNTVIRKLQDSNGNFLFTGQDLMNRTLWGYPIHLFEDMAKPTTGVTYADAALPVAFGDWKTSYTIVDRVGMSVLRDPFTSKGYVKYYTTRRVGGGMTNFEALKLLKIKAA